MDDSRGEDTFDLSDGEACWEVSAFKHRDLNRIAYHVARYGPEYENVILNDRNWKNRVNFLQLEDPNHTQYQHKVSEFKTLLQARVPFSSFYIKNLPPRLVVEGDMLAQDVARMGTVVEDKLLADLKEDPLRDDEIFWPAFLNPKASAVFHYYQYRLMTYRAQVEAGKFQRLINITDDAQISPRD